MEEMWRDYLSPPPSKGVAAFSLTLSSNSSHQLRDQRDHGEENDREGGFLKGSRDHELLTAVAKPSFVASLNSPFEGLAVASSSVSLFTCLFNKNKRVPEDRNDDHSTGDQRLKRRMKNRESAARSRARRQAYTSMLEREHAQLTEENARLREQQKKLVLSASSEKPNNKRGHSRSLTAPF